MDYWYARTVLTDNKEWWAIGTADYEIAYAPNLFTARRICALLNDASARIEKNERAHQKI